MSDKKVDDSLYLKMFDTEDNVYYELPYHQNFHNCPASVLADRCTDTPIIEIAILKEVPKTVFCVEIYHKKEDMYRYKYFGTRKEADAYLLSQEENHDS